MESDYLRSQILGSAALQVLPKGERSHNTLVDYVWLMRTRAKWKLLTWLAGYSGTSDFCDTGTKPRPLIRFELIKCAYANVSNSWVVYHRHKVSSA